ncbi:MAG TPA: PAS domain-containing protein [Chondromyces sp.]|nr:PAS domain-containing protein [Chondromyces sp.]
MVLMTALSRCADGPGDQRHLLRTGVMELERRLRDAVRAAWSPGSTWAEQVFESDASAVEDAVSELVGGRPVMLFIADLVEGRFLWINDTVSDVLGTPVRELLESSFLDRVHPDDLPRTMLEMGRLAAGEPTMDFSNRHRHADGTYRVFQWAATADADGELCFALAVEDEE